MTNGKKPKLLIEQWLPIAEIGAECMRERGASSALPPLYFLHVWWARRPLTVSRAAILASLLPAYPVSDDPDVKPWPAKFVKHFPTFDSYKTWFIRLIGIFGDPVQGRKVIEWAKKANKQLRFNPYGYPRAFTVNPTEDQLSLLYELLEWTWGTREVTFCDPMSGGGSIPFEALRYGLTVHANELNPVASVILKATLDFPQRIGQTLANEVRKYGTMWADSVRKRLESYYPLSDERESIFCYVWARTIACPTTGKPVPLSPNWWLRKGDDPVAVKVIADVKSERCNFQIVKGKDACARANPDKGTIKRGTAVSPWTGDSIDGGYIKSEAQAGRMGQQLYCVGGKKAGEFVWRPPTAEDEAANHRASEDFSRLQLQFQSKGYLPTFEIPYGHRSHERDIIVQYGITRWTDMFTHRQLLFHCLNCETLSAVREQARKELGEEMSRAVATYLGIMADKCVDYNSRLMRWDGTRNKIANTFDRHDFSFKWSHAEFDAARNLLPWALSQVLDAYTGITKLSHFAGASLFPSSDHSQPVTRLSLTCGPAQSLAVESASLKCITVDPPYYNNVNYAELSDFFYVWARSNLGSTHPEFFRDTLTPKDDEATANPARFHSLNVTTKVRKQLAEAEYENKMMACFKEMSRVLAPEGVLTVMFTHKKVEAWDTLGSALLRAGFKIEASWPVHTESSHSLHIAKKNAAASTILLTCRKRNKSTEPAWWDDLKAKVRKTARQKAEEFEKQGIAGVDLYISTFGPVLSIISENWPVLTSQSDPKTGDPLPLKPGEALDLARQEVIGLRKQGLLLGRSVSFDTITDWYLLAWDAFRAQEFPADEGRKLALALGLDLERHIIREKRLVTKKSATVVLNLPAARRRKDMVDEDAERFSHLIDALHTAMMIYDEEGSKACQVFVDRQGLRNDGRIKALVEALMNAIPTTRDKKGLFLRPEMTTLEAMRLLFWPDLPAPKEEEPPKMPEKQLLLAGMEEIGDDAGDDGDEDDEDEAD